MTNVYDSVKPDSVIIQLHEDEVRIAKESEETKQITTNKDLSFKEQTVDYAIQLQHNQYPSKDLSSFQIDLEDKLGSNIVLSQPEQNTFLKTAASTITYEFMNDMHSMVMRRDQETSDINNVYGSFLRIQKGWEENDWNRSLVETFWNQVIKRNHPELNTVMQLVTEDMKLKVQAAEGDKVMVCASAPILQQFINEQKL